MRATARAMLRGDSRQPSGPSACRMAPVTCFPSITAQEHRQVLEEIRISRSPRPGTP